jgi:aspartate aminotransferase
MQISDRIQNVAESGSLKMAARCREMQAAGVDVISMTLGEPDFAAPEHIKEAAIAAIRADYSHYGPVPGYPALREAIAKTLPIEAGFTANDIIVSSGAKQSLYNVVVCSLNSGDEAIIPTPSWVSYSEMVKLADARPVIVKTSAEHDWKMTAEQLAAAITPKTRMLILCSPNNPTGSVYSEKELDAIVDVLKKHPEVTVVADEIYNAIVYGKRAKSMAEYREISDRVVIINGVSKAYAMTGYRIGWMASKNSEIVAACKRLQGQSTTCANTVAQKAAEVAYTGDQSCVEEMREEYSRRRELILELMNEIPQVKCSVPDGAFYVFPDVSAYYGGKIGSSHEMTEYLLNEAHVACVAGADFGEDKCIRLSYATSRENLREAMQRIKKALEKL